MKREIVKDKKGTVLKTKDGIELEEFKFEVGDVFIPSFNRITEIKHENSEYTNFLLKCKVKDKDDKDIINNKKENEIFVTLTPAQCNSLKKKIEDGVELNQHMFIAYEYEHEGKKYVGVGLKSTTRPAKAWDDFEE